MFTLQKSVRILILILFSVAFFSSFFVENSSTTGVQPAQALANNLALTPPMGWNSWNKYGCNINETLIRGMADSMVSSGMAAAGYKYVNLDDCWQSSRDASGNIVADPTAFPSGIKALADYVHSKGLKLGVYSDRGTNTCAGRPGSQGHEVQDANSYAAWGVDYLKYDNCNASLDQKTQYQAMRDALLNSGRQIVYSLCHWAFQSWDSVTGNLSRTTGDISDNWSSMISRFDQNAAYAASSAPGYWNDPDMLEVGNGGMTATEDQTHFSLWAISAAPLITGTDLQNMSTATKNTFMNSEVIAVDQDPLGIQGVKVSEATAGLQVWSKKLSGSGQRAVVLLNRNSSAANITVRWADIGLATGSASVRDLWAKADRGSFSGGYTASVQPHGVVMIKVTGSEPAAPQGTVNLSSLPTTYAAQQWGTLHLNQSVLGNPLKLRGTTYSTGLGTHANSLIYYNMGANCTAFKATVGIDDDAGGSATAQFKVYADGSLLYDSGVVTQTSAAKSVNINVTGKSDLRLVVYDAGDNINYDHADWAGAALTCNSGTVASYEAESSANTLAGGARVASCTSCSGSQKVGFVGNNSGTLTFNGVSVSTSGSYTLTIYFLNGDASRSSQMRINGGSPITINFGSTGSFNTVGSMTITVALNAGSNTIRFSNDTAGLWAPDFDRITVSGGPSGAASPLLSTTPTFVPAPTP